MALVGAAAMQTALLASALLVPPWPDVQGSFLHPLTLQCPPHTCSVLPAAWQLGTSYTATALCIPVGVQHWPLLPAGGSVTVTNNNAGTTTVTPDSNGNPTVNGQVGMGAC